MQEDRQPDARGAFQSETLEVFVLDVRFQFMKNFNYLVVDKARRDALIVDPAWEIDKIDAALLEARAVLRGVLITHSHSDHINLARTVSERHGCPIFMSKAEIAFSGFTAADLVPIDAAPRYIGPIRVEPIFSPGHTPGCLCYLIEDNLFTGDVLFAEGCGMCPDLESAKTMYFSLQELRRRTSERTRVFPGHSYGRSPGQTMAQVMRDNMYLHFKDEHSFAAFRMRRGQSREKLFRFS